MTVPSFLPDWVPPWVQLVLLVGIVLVMGAYLAMPFSVFGVKARLDALDERLDEMQRDLRAFTNRAPDSEMGRPAAWRRGAVDDEDFAASPPFRRDRAPPAPPAPAPVFDRDRDRDRSFPPFVQPPPPPPPRRSEPQLNWPENRPRI